jgi:hypothetical protein
MKAALERCGLPRFVESPIDDERAWSIRVGSGRRAVPIEDDQHVRARSSVPLRADVE